MPKHDVDVFSVRDLRIRSSELVRNAEAGNVSVITKRGSPAALTLPFGRRLLELGIDKELASVLFERYGRAPLAIPFAAMAPTTVPGFP